ncbi:hypothetical protein NSK_000316 [Nannochloropsis salina CCMP1776]|uniref:Uncharacterized protein n=1 Tax=Nannochloropsis salina CCMP1776 TaxID=1027361 RepID=A0A4D9DE58_9STRA|nr:hypothetical protein NSK_000316 [Nannochloropsis salina CCMP1776]|eukprot:TFJ88747.1 hypothetical protein NSK_000316 [Nannochloropsis salina CCMP1776]
MENMTCKTATCFTILRTNSMSSSSSTLKSRGILDEEDSQEIAALVKACKGNVQGFASWKAMHAHACSYQDAYHSRIRRFLEESKGVAPVKTSSVGKVAPDALPLVEPTDLEAVYRSLSFPTPLKYLDPPVIELSGLNGSMDSTAKIMQFVVGVLPEILSDSDKSLVVSVHIKFGEGAIFMKRAAIQLCTNNKGRAAAHCVLTRIDNSKVLHPIHDADVMRYSYPKLYKKLYKD